MSVNDFTASDRGGISEATGSMGQTVIKSGRLSESRADCHKVGQTVIKSGRLSDSRADCQQVGQTVIKSGRLP